jgi:hypothetical protein
VPLSSNCGSSLTPLSTSSLFTFSQAAEGDFLKAIALSRAAHAALSAFLAGVFAALLALGLTYVDVEGDGNCGPRALSVLLYQTEEKHESVRRAVVAYLRSPGPRARLMQRMNMPAGYYDAEVNRMADNGEEVDVLFMTAAFGAFPRLKRRCAGFVIAQRVSKGAPVSAAFSDTLGVNYNNGASIVLVMEIGTDEKGGSIRGHYALAMCTPAPVPSSEGTGAGGGAAPSPARLPSMTDDAELSPAPASSGPLPSLTGSSVTDVPPSPPPARTSAQMAVLNAARVAAKLARDRKRRASNPAAAVAKKGATRAAVVAADSAGDADAETLVGVVAASVPVTSPQLPAPPPPIQRRKSSRAASASAASASAAPAPTAPAPAARAPAAPAPGGVLGAEHDAPSHVHPCIVCGTRMRRGAHLVRHCFEMHRDAFLSTVPVRDKSGSFPAFLFEGHFSHLADAEAELSRVSARLGTTLRLASTEASATARVRVFSCASAEKSSVVGREALHRCVSELRVPTETGRDSDAAHERKVTAGLLRGRIGLKALEIPALACFFTVVLTSTRPLGASAATPDGSTVEEGEDDRTWPVHMQVLGGHTHLPPAHGSRRGGKSQARANVSGCATSASPLHTFCIHCLRSVCILYNISSIVDMIRRLWIYIST